MLATGYGYIWYMHDRSMLRPVFCSIYTYSCMHVHIIHNSHAWTYTHMHNACMYILNVAALQKDQRGLDVAM